MAEPIRAILLDIEGTTSSISFVYDVMFPFARKHFEPWLKEHWNETVVQQVLPVLAADLELPGTESLFGDADSDLLKCELVVRHLIAMMDDDIKATGLKQIQGMVWEDGFRSGEMVAHVYDDVRPALERWQCAGIDIRIYSSGSVHAQKLFFAHSVQGDLLPFFNGHYDTTVGAKREVDSYRSIATEFGMESSQILFVSDIVDELAAAQQTGMQTALSLRPGNKPIDSTDGWCAVTSFDQIVV